MIVRQPGTIGLIIMLLVITFIGFAAAVQL